MSKSYLVTGSNSGLGLDTSRQLALRDDVAKVYMTARSEAKATAAMNQLVEQAGVSRDKLAFVPFDGMASQADIAKAVDGSVLGADILLDGIVLNAGGAGADTEGQPTAPNQILPIAQINVGAHAHLVDHLLQRGNIHPQQTRVIFSSSEGARGIKVMGMPSPEFAEDTQEYFTTYLDGSHYHKNKGGYDAMASGAYADVKGLGTFYFSAWGRDKGVYTLNVSPGGTKGTAFAKQESMGALMGCIFPIIMTIFGWFGFFHSLETGAKRYADAVVGEGEFADFASGAFVASKSDAATGPVADQVETFATAKQYGDVDKQNAAYAAFNAFLYGSPGASNPLASTTFSESEC